MVAGECPGHRAPGGARSPRSVNEQQRRRLPRAVVDHVHPVRVLNFEFTHARDDTGRPAIGLGQMSAPPRAAPNQPAPHHHARRRPPLAALTSRITKSPASASRPAASGSCLAYGDGGPDADGMQKIMNFDLATAAGSRAVIVVEGMSDRVALETLAERRGIALRAQGISIVHLDGATNIGHFLDLFGPHGLDVRLAGLCDAA